MELLITLTLASFVFTSGGYIFTWKCYTALRDKIENHLKHELAELRDEVAKLKGA